MIALLAIQTRANRGCLRRTLVEKSTESPIGIDG